MDIQEAPEDKPILTCGEVHLKGWGHETWIHNDSLYCGKLLFIKKDAIMSYHYHKDKTETFYLYSGKVVAILGTEDNEFFRVPTHIFRMEPGDVLELPSMTPHSIIALEDSLIMEVSTKHNEEDSFRIVKGD